MLAAVIFDLDGTILDNEGVWEQAFQTVEAKNGLTPFVHEPGIGLESNWKKYGKDQTEVVRLAGETAEAYWQLVGDVKNIPVREGTLDLVEFIRDRGWLIALTTGSNWSVVERELEELNLYLAFDVTTTGEEVAIPKPDPEIFSLTAWKLGVEVEECVVIEDSAAGVEAAREAGMKVINIGEADLGADWLVGEMGQIAHILSSI